MNNNPYIIERLMNDRLAELRKAGMRDQSLAQAGLKGRTIHLPDLRLTFGQMVRQLKMIPNVVDKIHLRNPGRIQEARNE